MKNSHYVIDSSTTVNYKETLWFFKNKNQTSQTIEIFDRVNGSCFQVASEFRFLTLNDKQKKAKLRLRQSLSEVISTIKFAFFCNFLEPVERKWVWSSSESSKNTCLRITLKYNFLITSILKYSYGLLSTHMLENILYFLCR